MKPQSSTQLMNDGDGHLPMKRSEAGAIAKAFKAYKLKGEPVGKGRFSFAKRRVVK